MSIRRVDSAVVSLHLVPPPGDRSFMFGSASVSGFQFDEALDHLRKDADRGWGVVLIAWDEGNPPDRKGGEPVLRTHFLRVHRRNAKARSPQFHNGLEEQVARFGLFPPNEVTCPLFQSERFTEHLAGVLGLTEHWAGVLGLTEHWPVVLVLCSHGGGPY